MSIRSTALRFAPAALAAALLAAAGAARAGEAPPAAEPLPFAADAAIEAMANEITRQWPEPARRVDSIIRHIFEKHEGALGFEYRSHPTLTAVEAFRERKGNCMTLVNLFVAMGRAVGLKVFFVEVEDFETFYRYEGTVVRSTHVVGGLVLDGELRTIDFLPDRDKRYRSLKIISDQRAVAHYYNDVGAEALLAGDLARAETLLVRAIASDGSFTEGWNNYAILARRAGDLPLGIQRLERALALDRHFLPAMENLSGYYRLAGDLAAAERMSARALAEKTRNPYYLTHQAFGRILERDFDGAEKLLKRARRLDGEIPEVHLLLGRVALARGDAAAAEGHFARARRESTEFPETFQSQLDAKIKRLVLASKG
jgi:tetratricopeptide (TPR) repeat protein